MRKALLILATIAILGIVGMGSRNQSASSLHLAGSSSNQTANVSSVSSASNPSPGVTPTSTSGTYKDGTYTGTAADTPYGTVQIAVVISSGKITDVNFLQMPSDLGHSREVTAGSEPLLKQTTLQTQNVNIDFVSGATSTSFGYEQSLQAALNQAKVG